MSTFSGQLGDPPIYENEEFLDAFYAQHESQAGKIRNQTRQVNNILSGRNNSKLRGSDLTPSDIELIVNATRLSHLRYRPLCATDLKCNPTSLRKRRSEAFAILTSWRSGLRVFSEKGACYLLEPANLDRTRRLGIEHLAEEVQGRIISDVENGDQQASGNFDDDDVPMLPQFDAARTPSPVPLFQLGIHRSMLDFHMPYSHAVNIFLNFICVQYLYIRYIFKPANISYVMRT